MKCITRTIAWATLVSGLSLALHSSHASVDPTDDFSFAMTRTTPAPEAVSLMSEAAVEKILVDHLDLFPRSKAPALAAHILTLARKYRFDPAFILSVIQVESSFRVKIQSFAGAIGLMQLMPATAEVVAKRHGIPYNGARSLNDPFTNVSLGVAYLSYLRDKYRGQSPYYHIAAYNLGPARLNELRSQKSFKPSGTKQYYLKIRKGVPRLRFYRAGLTPKEFAGV